MRPASAFAVGHRSRQPNTETPPKYGVIARPAAAKRMRAVAIQVWLLAVGPGPGLPPKAKAQTWIATPLPRLPARQGFAMTPRLEGGSTPRRKTQRHGVIARPAAAKRMRAVAIQVWLLAVGPGPGLPPKAKAQTWIATPLPRLPARQGFPMTPRWARGSTPRPNPQSPASLRGPRPRSGCGPRQSRYGCLRSLLGLGCRQRRKRKPGLPHPCHACRRGKGSQ